MSEAAFLCSRLSDLCRGQHGNCKGCILESFCAIEGYNSDCRFNTDDYKHFGELMKEASLITGGAME